jgi:MFS family permease
VLAFGLSAFAVGSSAVTVIAGALVDRLSARRLVPFSLVAMFLACLTLAGVGSAEGALLYFGLLGVQSGLMSVIHGAIWAEIYGVTHLGSISALATPAMVFASGLAPALVGILIGWYWTVTSIALLMAGYTVAATILATVGIRGALGGVRERKCPLARSGDASPLSTDSDVHERQPSALQLPRHRSTQGWCPASEVRHHLQRALERTWRSKGHEQAHVSSVVQTPKSASDTCREVVADFGITTRAVARCAPPLSGSAG